MAQWNIRVNRRKLKLDYLPHPCEVDPVVRSCGESDSCLFGELVAFVAQSAAPFDLISMPDGSMFCLQHEVTSVS